MIIGAGNRGNVYASYSKSFPDEMQVLAVAEPNPKKRNAFAKAYPLSNSHCFESWEEAIGENPPVNAVIISTQDQIACRACSGRFRSRLSCASGKTHCHHDRGLQDTCKKS